MRKYLHQKFPETKEIVIKFMEVMAHKESLYTRGIFTLLSQIFYTIFVLYILVL